MLPALSDPKLCLSWWIVSDFPFFSPSGPVRYGSRLAGNLLRLLPVMIGVAMNNLYLYGVFGCSLDEPILAWWRTFGRRERGDVLKAASIWLDTRAR